MLDSIHIRSACVSFPPIANRQTMSFHGFSLNIIRNNHDLLLGREIPATIKSVTQNQAKKYKIKFMKTIPDIFFELILRSDIIMLRSSGLHSHEEYSKVRIVSAWKGKRQLLYFQHLTLQAISAVSISCI